MCLHLALNLSQFVDSFACYIWHATELRALLFFGSSGAVG